MKYEMFRTVLHRCVVIVSACILLYSCDNQKTKKPPSLDKLKERIFYQINHGDYSGAIVVCDSVINIHGKNNWVLTRKATAYYYLSRYKSSLYCLTEALSFDTTNFETYYWLGSVRKADRDTLGAFQAFTKAISLNPSCSFCYNSRGYLYYCRNNLDSAILDLKHAVYLDSNSVLAWSNLGKTYSSLNNFDSALYCFNKGISITPTGSLYNGRGSIYYAQKKFDSAVNDFTVALMYESQNPDYYLNRAFAYAELHRMAAMCDDFWKAHEYGSKEGRAYYQSNCVR